MTTRHEEVLRAPLEDLFLVSHCLCADGMHLIFAIHQEICLTDPTASEHWKQLRAESGYLRQLATVREFHFVNL